MAKEDEFRPWQGKREVRCVVACRDANGQPDFFDCRVLCTGIEYSNGDHYDAAELLAEDNGYESEMLVYDEYDGPAWLFERFDWARADITSVEEGHGQEA